MFKQPWIFQLVAAVPQEPVVVSDVQTIWQLAEPATNVPNKLTAKRARNESAIWVRNDELVRCEKILRDAELK